MQQYIDSGDHKPYERQVQKKTSLFYRQAMEEKQEFAKSYEKNVENLELLVEQPQLHELITHFEERNSQFYHRLDRIMKNEGGLLEYARGYMKYGVFNTTEGTKYLEWAPEAKDVAFVSDNGDVSQCVQTGPDWETQVATPQYYWIRVNNNEHRIPCWARSTKIYNNQLVGTVEDLSYEFTQPNRKPEVLKIFQLNMNSQKQIDLQPLIDQGYNCFILKGLLQTLVNQDRVACYFAPNSHDESPVGIKKMIDYIHSMNCSVLLDFPLEVDQNSPLVQWDGSPYHYISVGTTQPHLDFDKWELCRYLYSAMQYWQSQYMIDGFRFPNLDRVVQNQQGILNEDLKHLLIENSRIDGLVFLMFANDVIHKVNPNAITIATEMPVQYPSHTTIKAGGLGFDYINIKID